MVPYRFGYRAIIRLPGQSKLVLEDVSCTPDGTGMLQVKGFEAQWINWREAKFMDLKWPMILCSQSYPIWHPLYWIVGPDVNWSMPVENAIVYVPRHLTCASHQVKVFPACLPQMDLIPNVILP